MNLLSVLFCSCRTTMQKEPKLEKAQKDVPLANWSLVGIKKQDAMFFANVRKLNASSFDPKYELENKHVIAKECWFLFGGFKKFKIKSPGLNWKMG